MALVGTLTDTFSGASVDLAKWPSVNGPVVESGGTLQMTPPDANVTSGAYDLTNSAIYVQVVQATNVGNGSPFTNMAVEFTGGNRIDFLKEGSLLKFRRVIANVVSDTSVTYDPAVHIWWKTASSSGNIVFSTSVDGLTWTVRRTTTVSWAITSINVHLSSGINGTEPAPGVAIMDNFNVPPVILPRPIRSVHPVGPQRGRRAYYGPGRGNG